MSFTPKRLILSILYFNRVPALATAVLLLSGEKMPDNIDSAFFYGRPQVRRWTKLTFQFILLKIFIKCFLRGHNCYCTHGELLNPPYLYVLCQIICTTVVLALSILLGGGSLMGLSRGSWDPNYQILGRVSAFGTTEDLRPEEEPERQSLFEPVTSSGSINGGTVMALLFSGT